MLSDEYTSENNLYLIEKGIFKIYEYHKNGKISLIQYLEKGDLIGELGLLGVEAEKKVVTSHGNSRVLKIKSHVYEDFLKENPVFLKYLSVNLATKLFARTHHFTEMQQYKLKPRLLMHIKRTHIEGSVDENFTYLSQYLGTSYRHLMFTLKALIDEGIIEKRDHIYQVNSFEKLNKAIEKYEV
ncbi:Regulatory protein YeiL [Staphylococcus intermedius NCTC 11048]|uniref:HTH-type transcriptional regulator ArcR n=1 Tax=Staphylococcus intermedius NCTC 11048 TaxID=1141106 RepID=A0A380G3Y0_STAIN|nr:Regulatory protein YeiL [Staphylococcus intermedius NCTC 11048]